MCRRQCRHDGVKATGDLQAAARTRQGQGDRRGAGCSTDRRRTEGRCDPWTIEVSRIEQGRGGEEKEMQRDGILTDYKYLLDVIEGYLMEIASTLR